MGDNMKLTMGIWREIEKIELDTIAGKEYLKKQCDHIAEADEEYFDVLSKKLEITIAEHNESIFNRKKEVVKKVLDTEENIEDYYLFIRQAITALADKKAKEMPDTKESSINYESMNAYQQIIHIYSVLHREYHWTRQIIDDEEIEYIYDLTISQALANSEKKVSIDSVL